MPMWKKFKLVYKIPLHGPKIQTREAIVGTFLFWKWNVTSKFKNCHEN